MRSFKRMLLGAVASMVIAAGLAVSPASATVPSQGYATQDANVPYLAWRGEHVRLVYCDENYIRDRNANASWILEDWSGDPANGSVPVPAEVFGSRQIHDGCAYTDWVSQKSGVAFVKLVLSDPQTGANLYEKQFIVAWMDILKPTVTGGGDVNAGDLCHLQEIAPTAEKILSLGPYSSLRSGDRQPAPRQVIVKGNIPLLANFSEWGLGDHLTMPDDWAKWAAVMARSTVDHGAASDPAGAMSNWDIHDDSLLTEGHVITNPLGTQCPADPNDEEVNPTGTTDAVDNCHPTARSGAASRRCSARPVARRPHDRAVGSDLPVRHAALGRQGRRG